MNWLTNFVKPKLSALVKRKDVPKQEISRQYQMSAEVKNAVCKVIGYLETYEIDKTNLLWEKGITLHKPSGIIIIGRSSKENRRALKSLNSYFHNLEILTYDDMVEIANNFIKLIESKKGEMKC